MLRSFKDLLVWQKSYALAIEVYRCTGAFPAQEMYGLTAQLRRAAVSIPSNIAEGYCRKRTAEYIRFAGMAYASLGELSTQLMLSRDLGYLDGNTYDAISLGCEELERMLAALIRSLKTRQPTAHQEP